MHFSIVGTACCLGPFCIGVIVVTGVYIWAMNKYGPKDK